MDDLVERLRDWPYQGETMAHLAADEITALRARLEAVERELIEEQRISTLRGDMIEFELTPALHYAEAALKEQTHLIEQFFALLDKTEQTDDGRSFHPNQLRSCRASDTEKLNRILMKLKGTRDNALL